MTTREHALILVRKAKADLKTETDPDKRHRIAIWGEEMNDLALSLGNINIKEPADKKVCTRCCNEFTVDNFRKIVSSYTHKNGSITKYHNLSSQCKTCLAEIRKENDFRKIIRKK